MDEKDLEKIWEDSPPPPSISETIANYPLTSKKGDKDA